MKFRRYYIIRLFVWLCLVVIGKLNAQTIVLNDTFYAAKVLNLRYASFEPNLHTIDEIISAPFDALFDLDKNELLLFNENEYKDELWVKIPVINNLTYMKEVILELDNSLINQVDIYAVVNSKPVKHLAAGDELPAKFRTILYRNFLLSALIKPSDSLVFYVKCNLGGRKIHLPLNIYSVNGLTEHIARREIWLGFYYGILAMVTLLFLYMSFLIKDKAFAWFGVYMLVHTLLQMSISGMASIYLWPNMPLLNDVSVVLLMNLSIFFGLGFVIHFITKSNFKSWIYLAVNALKWFALVVSFMAFFPYVFYNTAVWITYRLIPLFYFFMFAIAFWYYIKRFVPARFFMLALVAALCSISGIFYYAYFRKHGNVFTNNTVIISELLKCFILGLALLDRLKFFKEENEKAQAEAIKNLKEINELKERMNEQLEIKVREKSKELIQKQSEVQRALIAGEENERKRVAQDLHDGLGSLLSTIRLNAESIDVYSKNLNDAETNAYKNVLEMIDKACFELRHITQNMLPAGIEHFGLIATVKSLINKINTNSSAKFYLDAIGVGLLNNKEIELNLYRIILELINNTLKHAKAENVNIQITKHDGMLTLLFEDDGIGFNTNEKDNSGLGLLSIKTRTEALNGKLTIDSKRNNGTTTIIEIPYDSK